MKKFLGFLLFSLGLIFSVNAFAADENNNNFEAGRDYLVLPLSTSSKAFNPPNKISVVEFFSYGCPACFHFDPTLESWLKHMPAQVDFDRIPVTFESDWHLYARAYYVAKIIGIEDKISSDMFNGLQTQRLDLGTPERMAAFFHKNFNVKTEIFMNTYDSPVVDQEMAASQRAINDFMIFQVPGLIIDGKYKVDPSMSGSNPNRLINTVNYLIQLEKKTKKL